MGEGAGHLSTPPTSTAKIELYLGQTKVIGDNVVILWGYEMAELIEHEGFDPVLDSRIDEVRLPMELGEKANPAGIGWSSAFVYELAMGQFTIQQVCEDHRVDSEKWEALRLNPRFREEVVKARESLKKEGTSFRWKASLQADELLDTSWEMIHDKDIPAVVRADLIKFTVKAAGYSEPGQGKSNNGSMVSIVIDLGNRS